MTVYQINPLADPRWPEFVANGHPDACAFHTQGWLQALHDTYGYEPVAFTTSASTSDLANAVVLCRIKSWLTGSRLVSLPFSDHCQPLVHNPEDLYAILDWIKHQVDRSQLRYVELRPLHADSDCLRQRCALDGTQRFQFHSLDLSTDIESLFRTFDKNCVQRRVRHSERVNLNYDEGRNTDLLHKFYGLLLLTRRRHCVPPQPFRWFQNLAVTMGKMLKVRLLSINEVPVAGILTLEHNRRVIYKYGCSDYAYNHLGATANLFWRAIRDAKSAGAYRFDMGRSDLDNPGLIAFKSKWGTTSELLTYWRYPMTTPGLSTTLSQARRTGGRLLSYLPTQFLLPASNFLYRHAG